MSIQGQHDFDALAEAKVSFNIYKRCRFSEETTYFFVSSLTESCDAEKHYKILFPSKKSVSVSK